MSDDLIKRADAIKVLDDNTWLNGTSILDANEAVKQLKDLPSADRPQGEAPLEHGYMWTCPKCELDVHSDFESCPRCGYMRDDRPQGEWIPCSERLPSEKDYISDMVIWCTDKSIVSVGWYYESTKSWATIDDIFPPSLGEVIAWMPLPEPWKGAKDE